MTANGRRGGGGGARGRRRKEAFCMLVAASVLAAAWGAGAAEAAHGQQQQEENGGGGKGAAAAAAPAVRAPLPEARVPSVSVAILGNGTVEVEHRVSGGGEAARVPLLGGQGGRPVDVRAVGAGGWGGVGGIEVSDDGSYAVVPAAGGGGDLLVRYGLEGAMRLSEPSTYSWSFLYRATTSFTLPDGVDVAFVNGQAVHFTGARAFTCHGCQMELEFTVDEPRSVQTFELGGGAAGGPKRMDVGVWTAAKVGPLALDPASGSIAYEAGGVSDAGGRWVTLVVPPGLIGPPYRAEIGGESAPVTTFDAGGGLIGVSARPAEDGTVRIFGSAAAAEAGPGGGDEKGGGGHGLEGAAGTEGDPGGAPAEQGGEGAGEEGAPEAAAGIAAAVAAAGIAAACIVWLRRRNSGRARAAG